MLWRRLERFFTRGLLPRTPKRVFRDEAVYFCMFYRFTDVSESVALPSESMAALS
jgi:hypothetical protein